MKRILYFLTVLSLLVSCHRTRQVSSPDGTVRLSFRLTDAGSPEYCIEQDGATVIGWSALGLLCAEADLTRDFRLQGTDSRFYQDTWETVWGEEREINDTHCEMTAQPHLHRQPRTGHAYRSAAHLA